MSRISTLRTLILIGMLLAINAFSNAQVTDDFSDGDFSLNPTWQGDVSSWEVNAESELHLNAPSITDEAYLSTPSNAILDGLWELSLRMEFNPSGDNRSYVYLCSDQEDLENPLQGYFVMVGNTADEISLYRQDGGSTVKIIDGQDDSVDLSLVEATIKVTRDATGNWELFSDVGNSGSFTSEGTAFDDTYITSNYFGFRCDYTSTRSDLFYFDNLNVTGSGFVDTTPPTIENLTVLNSTSLRVIFSEAVSSLEATSVDSYEWNGTNPLTATLDTDTVWLEFVTEFPFNVTQSLSVTGIPDLNGNVLTSEDVEFTFLSFGVGTYGSIIFNEFMADPTPVIGLPDAEYIELFNASDSAFNLLGWNLSNSGDEEILNSHVLLPGEYVIICDDAFQTIFSAFGEVLVVTSLTALSNTGDELQLFNSEGSLIDNISYTTSWYGGAPFNEGGYALERSNPFLPCSSILNWGPSSSLSGGTPGTQNSNFTQEDSEPPFIETVSVLSTTSIQLGFNEVMDELSLILGSYTIAPSATAVPTVNSTIDAVTLEITPALLPGETYTLTISDLQDCSGNSMPDTTLTFIIPDEPVAGDVIFNEIMADPSPPLGLPEFEYLELYNRSDKTLELEGWSLLNTTTEMVLNSFLMAPGSYVILCDEGASSDFSSFGNTLGIPSFSALSNSGDDIYLFDSAGELMDEVVYTLAWYNDASRDDGGYSLERINPELPCSGLSNWMASSATLGGSPGQQNANLDLSPDEQAPEATSAVLISPMSILIQFNEIIEASSVSSDNFNLLPAVDINSAFVNGPSSLILDLSAPLDTGTVYSLTLNSVADCSGNLMVSPQTFLIALPEPAKPGDLILNEVLFNPRTGGSDFVELYNRSPRAISLKNWKISNIDANGVLENVDNITSDDRVLMPGAFVFLTEDVQNIILNYPLSVQGSALEMADLPTLSDDEGNIILVTPDIEVHDAFYYSDDYHFALIDDLNGVSLERVDYNRLTNDPTNWHSASENAGWATPGYENSQLQPSNNTGQSFAVEPKVFSPDNDGFEDILHINYAMDRPGQLANITIFDREGRAVRLLARNHLLGTSGTISWDGINEDGNKARIGVYVIFIEVLDLNGSISSSKKTCVLGGQF